MSKRSVRPPLYDLMKSVPRGTPTRVAAEMPSGPDPISDDPGQSWLTPGRVVRLPVGYLLVATTVVIMLVIAAYVIGHRRGSQATKADFEAQFLSRANGGGSIPGLSDPLNRDAGDVVARPQGMPEAGGSFETPGGGAPIAGGAAPAAWGPLASDPRQIGVTYFVLAETTPSGAERLARFCRTQGLETYVVPSKNTRLRQVIAFPGFTGSRSSPQALAIEARIHAIGDRWRRDESGSTNLRDAYPLTHR